MSNIRSNTKWLAFAQVTKMLLQVASITVLARLLSPEHYGIMAMTLPIINFAGIFRDFGISASIIQAPELSEQQWSSSFWASAAMGGLVCVLVCALAYPAAVFFRQQELFLALLAVSVTFPLAGLSAPYQALFERRGEFRKVTLVELSAQFLALALAIGCATAGLGFYSLIFQTIFASLVVTICYLFLAPWRPAFAVDRTAIGQMLKFSRGLLGFNIVNYLSRNSDTYIIGRALGAASLGVYNIAYRLMLFPLQSVTLVANRALYPELSRNQGEPAEMRRLYLGSIEFIAMITFPIMVGLWCLREPFVSFVFGQKWAGLADIIFWLAPVGLIQSITSTTGPVLMARGQTDKLFRLGIWGACFQVSGIAIGACFGLNAVAIGYLIGNLAYMTFQFRAVNAVLAMGLMQFLLPLRPAAVSALLMFVSIECVHWLAPAQGNALVTLLLGGAVGMAAYAGALFLVFPANVRRYLKSPKPKA